MNAFKIPLAGIQHTNVRRQLSIVQHMEKIWDGVALFHVKLGSLMKMIAIVLMDLDFVFIQMMLNAPQGLPQQV